ncbi:MAG: CD225/dispanin family protein [bacterium]
MFCSHCGTPNDDNSWKCISCGQPLHAEVGGPAQPRVHIPNYLVPAILCTIFCCVPFGIPAIVYAAGVEGKAARGDLQGAYDASAKARMWCWISFGVGIFFFIIGFVIGVLGAALEH